jgi:hypothetical protein
VVKWLALQTTNTEVLGSIPGHALGFFWGSWVWNGVHSASWSDKLSSYLNKEVMVWFGKLKMQLWDSMCWPHVNNPVPSGAVGKDCQRRLLSRPRFVRACSATDFIKYSKSVYKSAQEYTSKKLSLSIPLAAAFYIQSIYASHYIQNHIWRTAGRNSYPRYTTPLYLTICLSFSTCHKKIS